LHEPQAAAVFGRSTEQATRIARDGVQAFDNLLLNLAQLMHWQQIACAQAAELF
jgi:hypothetical protein